MSKNKNNRHNGQGNPATSNAGTALSPLETLFPNFQKMKIDPAKVKLIVTESDRVIHFRCAATMIAGSILRNAKEATPQILGFLKSQNREAKAWLKEKRAQQAAEAAENQKE